MLPITGYGKTRCAAAIGSIVHFIQRKRTWDGPSHHLWAKTFDRELSDVFVLQDEITREIVATIGTIGGAGGLLQQAELQRAARMPPESLEAYDHFLRAEVHLNKFTKEENKRARQEFQKAVGLDPNYAKADVAYKEIVLHRSNCLE